MKVMTNSHKFNFINNNDIIKSIKKSYKNKYLNENDILSIILNKFNNYVLFNKKNNLQTKIIKSLHFDNDKEEYNVDFPSDDIENTDDAVEYYCDVTKKK